MAEDKKLTEQEQAFIDALYGEAKGDPEKAKLLAGYPKQKQLRTIIKALSDEVVKEVQAFVMLNSFKAHLALGDVLDNPSNLGAANKVAAANSILDRAGITKRDKLEIASEAPIAILILPAKNSD